jgi:hypothetical protein
MKTKFLLFATALLLGTNVYAQSFKFGTVAADAGVGFRMYGVKAYSPVNNSDIIGLFVGVGLPTINAEVGLAKFLGAGIKYSRGAYAQQGFKVRSNDVDVCLNFHVANKSDKFDLPITLGYGFSKFKADQTVTSGVGQSIHANGGVINVSIAPHFYFSKYIGMYVRLGYNKGLYRHIDINDGTKNYTEADGAKWKMGGIDFSIGIAGKLDLFSKKD